MRTCSFCSFHRVYGITFYIFFFMYFYSLVLILSGDIETNPGPTNESVVDIIHLNVRSIRNKIDSLNAIVSDFDIACFTETHLDHKISNNDILLDGFDIVFRKDRNSYGGGVIIYTSNNIRSRRRIDLESANTECIWIEIDNLTSRLLLCCVYRPPHADSTFWRNL